MIGELRPYAEYRDSGLPWLGPTPAGWGLTRAKYLFREVDERSTTGKEELLSVSHLTGVTPRRLKTVTMFLAESNVGHKVCRPDDVVINTLWAWMGALGVARDTGIVSPAYGVYRPLAHSNMLPAYADHLLRTPLYAAEYQRRSTGVNSSRLRLYPEQFLRVPVLTPQVDEQAAIVRFLDWANGRLERAIRAKRKIMALLTEQERATVLSAVTSGLRLATSVSRPAAPWLSAAPEHWEIATIGAATTLIQTGPFGSQLHSHEYVTGGIPVINPSHIRDGQIEHSAAITIRPDKAKELARHILREGDIVVARRGELGRCAVVRAAEQGWICGTGSLLVRCEPSKLLPGFFQLVFSSSGIADELNLSSVGATMSNLNASLVARQRIPLPPMQEQREIVQFASNAAKDIGTIKAHLGKEIELLREYRSRLVADVVTGKLDVREAAVQLPDVPIGDATTEPVDDLDEPELDDEETPA